MALLSGAGLYSPFSVAENVGISLYIYPTQIVKLTVLIASNNAWREAHDFLPIQHNQRRRCKKRGF